VEISPESSELLGNSLSREKLDLMKERTYETEDREVITNDIKRRRDCQELMLVAGKFRE
jgi:hypothetical protein